MITIIAALQQKDNGIGKNGDVLFHIKKDFIHMRDTTMGHVVVMGRKTYESLPEKYRPLPGRTNIVITRDQTYGEKVPGGVFVMHSLAEALDAGEKIDKQIFILGGGEIYKEALASGVVDRLLLTLVEGDREADTFFPPWENFGTMVSHTKVEDEKEPLTYWFVEVEKK